MKDLFKRFGGRRLYTLGAAIAMFLVAVLVNQFIVSSTSSSYYARLIQGDVYEKERDFKKLAADTTLLFSLVNRTYNYETLYDLTDKEKGYLFFIYDKDTGSRHQLLFWNTQQAVPPMNFMNETDASRVVRLSNGLYIQTSKQIRLANNKILSVEGLLPVMWQYFVQIENLQKEFAAFPEAGKRVDIIFTPTEYPIKSSYGNTLFYLEKISAKEQETSWWSRIFLLAGIFLLIVYVHQTASYFGNRYGLLAGIAFLGLMILLMRMTTYYYPDLLDLRQFELFDPSIYSSSFVFSSLGDLMINSILFCWLMLFVSRRLPTDKIKPLTPKWLSLVCTVIALTLLVSVTFIFADILQSLVADAQISFNVTNIFSLTKYSFIGFLILGTLSLSYFFFSQMILDIIKRLSEGSVYFVILVTLFVGLAILTFSRSTTVVELNLYVLIWLVIYILMMQQKIFSGINTRLNISEVLFWLFVYSFSITGVIIFENKKIEFAKRKLFAEKLSLRADPSSERLLSIALTYFDNDFLQKNFDRFKVSADLNAELKDSIIKKSFSAYLDKYDTRIFTFDASEKSLFNGSPVSYDTLNTIFRIQGKETSIEDLKYFEKSYDKFSYIYKKDVVDTFGVNMGYFFVLSEPKRYKSEALIPELFRQTKELVPEYSPAYYYGVYSKLGLINYYNDYPFPTRLTLEQLPKFEFEVRKNRDYEELWYRHSSDKVVVIAKKDNSFIEGITLFSWLFSTFILLLFIYRTTAFLVRSRFRAGALSEYLQFSIRSQIHSTIIMVSLLSFLIIGVATILFFIKRYDRNNQDKLSRAIQIMVNEVQNQLADHTSFNNGILLFETGANQEVEQLMQEISEIHGTDVNLYDTSGTLRVSSNPLIYNKGVLSEKMNPIAYFNLNNLKAVQFVADEQMGKVAYISVYSPVRDEQGNAYAYLNIPSYSTQGELKQEISNFLVTIINLNAFIFLVAGAIALFITNRITYSFTLIGQKMRDINLQKINQEIQWNRKDEIGELVNEYNKMVHKLDESAEALAKSEREGAWRQMAKQVAHEIKNPLTPMKLSIQYLQKAIDNNSPQVKEMTGNVARTLIEQIDHLSKIASDFSQFANIGNQRNEVFDLHEVIFSLASLYDSMENVNFSWEPVNHKVMLYADKTQLNRLFTNLMQNAIEAPENQHKRTIEVHELVDGDNIIVSIRDNGGGIPVQTRDKIFMPNFTTKSSGTGLGLAMSKSIAEQSHGDIWFETIDGEGTTFYVKLPLYKGEVVDPRRQPMEA